MISVSHSSLGRVRRNWRSTRSSAVGVPGTPLHFGAPLRPAIPARCISIATALCPTSIPRPSVSSAYTRLAP